LRIAQVAPLYESVPPLLYGGTERVVSFLTEALVGQNHDVTLFASGDSRTRALLVPVWPKALRLDPAARDPIAPHVYLLERVLQEAADFDVVHFHTDYLHFPMARRQSFSHVTTLHGRLDIPHYAPLFREFGDMPVVSISNDQRKPAPDLHWMGTVHHGLPAGLYRFSPGPGKYLAFLGRISPEKRVDRAIHIARRAGIPLKIAAKVDAKDQTYYDDVIKPLLKGPGVEYLGEIRETEKSDFLGQAVALLFPIDWPEPFGLVMIEAMAMGTPVVAYRRGSVPEVVENGLTGFTVSTMAAAVKAVEKAAALDRSLVRRRFEERFTADRMARDYVAIYQRLAAAHDKTLHIA